MMSSSQSIPFFQQYQYTNQPVEDSPTISKYKMLHKELHHCHDNRLDDYDASSSNPSFLTSVSHPTKRKRDVDEITSSRRQDYDDSSSSSSDDEDDEGYILFPLHKRYASSSAFNVSSYDFERREGPADSTSSSTPTRHDDSSFVDDTTTSDDVLDEETAALVSNFRTSIFRNQTSTMAAVVQPTPITPLSDASLTTCSLYADDEHDSNDNYEGHHYPDFPSIGRATTIGEEHSYEEDSSSIFSDPPDMMDNSRSGTSSPRYEEEIMIEHHHCYEEEDERSTSSTTELPSSIEEKDAVEAAREHRPAWLVSSSSTRLEPSQPSPLWMPTATSTTNWTGMFHQ